MKRKNYEDHSDFKFYESPKEINKFMNSVTNEYLNGNVDREEDMYEVDKDDLDSMNHKMIYENDEINEKDKAFFVLWNDYVSENSLKPDFEKTQDLLLNFLRDNKAAIEKDQLLHNFYSHLLALYTYGQINQETITQALNILIPEQ